MTLYSRVHALFGVYGVPVPCTRCAMRLAPVIVAPGAAPRSSPAKLPLSKVRSNRPSLTLRRAILCTVLLLTLHTDLWMLYVEAPASRNVRRHIPAIAAPQAKLRWLALHTTHESCYDGRMIQNLEAVPVLRTSRSHRGVQNIPRSYLIPSCYATIAIGSDTQSATILGSGKLYARARMRPVNDGKVENTLFSPP